VRDAWRVARAAMSRLKAAPTIDLPRAARDVARSPTVGAVISVRK
jgi:hypothetical protein